MKIHEDSRFRSLGFRIPASERLVLAILFCSVLVISKHYKSQCNIDILNNIENTLYHSYKKLFWLMSISIEIEKDLKMHVFLTKTKNAHLFFAS